jgi:hypothetical protein
MKLNPPKKSTFWISVIAATVGFLTYLLSHFNLIAVAWLVLGLTLKGL